MKSQSGEDKIAAICTDIW